MADIVKTIEIRVDDSDLQGLDTSLESVSQSLDDVDGSGQKASQSVDDLAKNGGAIATLDRLTGGLASQMRDLYEASKLAGTGLRSAFIATGVGALVIALGTVLVYWEEIVDFVTQTNAKLEKQITLLEETSRVTKTQLDLTEKELELLELQGETNEELQKQRLALIGQSQEQINKQIELLEVQAENLKAAALELTTREKIVATVLNAVSAGSGEAFLAEKRLEASTKFLEIQERINALKSEAIDLEIKEFNARNTGSVDGSRAQIGGVGNVSQLAAENPRVLLADEVSKQLVNIEERTQQQILEAQARRQQEEIAREEFLNQQKLALTQQTLGAIVGILGETSAAGKAAGIAQALINTYTGISEVWRTPSVLPEPLATAQKLVSTATVLASGLQAVRQIQSTRLPGFATGGGGASANISTPAFNVVGASPVNQLAQTLQEQGPQEVFVVARNVETANELNRNIVETATIG